MIRKWFLFWSGAISGIAICYFQMKTEIDSGWASFWSSVALIVVYAIVVTVTWHWEQKAQ